MNSKGLRGVVLLVIIFSLIVSVSAESCQVKLKTDPSCTNPLMELSGLTNAHGAVYGSNSYLYAICCDFSGSSTCTGTNTVIKMSSSTNAHAEIPSNSNYGTSVCYSDLSCISQDGGICSGNYSIPVLSLSAATNAHIGGFADYTKKICCGTQAVPASCGNGIVEGVAGSCSWTSDISRSFSEYWCSDDHGAGVCDGSAAGSYFGWDTDGYSCHESDIASETGYSWQSTQKCICSPDTGETCDDGNIVDGDGCNSTCGIESGWSCVGSPSVCNPSSLCGNGIINSPETCDDSNLVNGDGCNATCSVEPGWSCLNEPSQCSLPEVHWENLQGAPISASDVIPETTKVRLVFAHSGLSPGDPVSFEVYEEDDDLWDLIDDDIRVGENALVGVVDADGTATTEWTISQADIDSANGFLEGMSWEFYFKVNGETSENLGVTLVGANLDQCEQIATCFGYTNQLYCEADKTEVGCGVARNIDALCEKNTSTPAGAGCYYTMDCNCGWDTGCGPYKQEVLVGSNCVDGGGTGYPTSTGKCTLSESGTTDTCEDGFLTYTWTALWEWDPSNVYNSEAEVPGYPGTTPVLGLDGKYHYNSTNYASCRDGTQTIMCPARIELPFFGAAQTLVAIAAIVTIYYFIFLSKKKHNKKLDKRSRKDKNLFE